MRELKFRLWNGTAMEYGGFAVHACGRITDISPSSRVKPKCEIMQCTGLETLDGTEIYEGDIVYVAGKGKVEVKFDCCGYWSFGECADYQDVMEDIEKVVGHIYENQ